MTPLTGIPGPSREEPTKKQPSKTKSNPTQTNSQNVVGPTPSNGNIDSVLNSQGVYLGAPSVVPISALINSYSKEQLLTIGKLMSKLNGKKYRDYDVIKTDLQTNYPALSTSFSKTVDILTDRLIPGSGSSGKYGTSVNTSVANYDPDVLGALVDQTYQATLGRLANKDEKRLRLAEIQKQIEAGTKTTTTTFKGGSKTITQPGFSQERAGIEIAAAAKAEAPQDLESMNQIKFHDFLLKNMGA